MGLFLGSNPALTSEEEKAGGGWTKQEEEEEEDSLGLWRPSFSSPPPCPIFSPSVSHVNPRLFCLRFLIAAEGQIMFITSRSVKKSSL